MADPLIENDCIIAGLIDDEMERLEIPMTYRSTNYDTKQELYTISETRFFDFVFVDADHREFSIKQDLKLAKEFTHDEGYILIDDIDADAHEQKNYYQNYLKPKNPSFYEIAGMGLIKNGDLTL